MRSVVDMCSERTRGLVLLPHPTKLTQKWLKVSSSSLHR